jgi:hypothetical protein
MAQLVKLPPGAVAATKRSLRDGFCAEWESGLSGEADSALTAIRPRTLAEPLLAVGRIGEAHPEVVQGGDSGVIDDRQSNLGMPRTDRHDRLAHDAAEPAAVHGEGLRTVVDLNENRPIGACGGC